MGRMVSRLGTNAPSEWASARTLDLVGAARNTAQTASSPASMAVEAVEGEDRSKVEGARSASAAAVLLETAMALRGGGGEANCQRAPENREGRGSEASGNQSQSGDDGVRLRGVGPYF
ncbi:hypothetical protein ON010_g7809 [Phytophthora cinnamomi]|nr:hypothetical protein ON010_g7809 [Phytophthora cinnamomi]